MKSILFLFLTLISIQLSADELFSGKITYEAKFELTDTILTQEEMKESYGNNQQDYFVTNGFYSNRRILDGELVYSNTYVHDKGFIYIDGPKRENIGLSNGNSTKSQVKSFEYLADTLIILGEECIKVMSYDTIDTSFSYVSTKTKIDYSLFSRHEAGSWNEKLKFTNGALSYQFTIKKKGYNVIFTAIKKEEQFLERHFFTKLANKPIIASFGALDDPAKVIGSKSFYRCLSSNVKVPKSNPFGLVMIIATVSKGGELKSAKTLLENKLNKKALKAFFKCKPGFKPPKVNGYKVRAEVFLTYILH